MYTGGAGEGGGFLKRAATATASTSRVFEYWTAAHWLLMQKETSQLHHVNNHVIELEPIGLRHLEFHDRTLDFVDRMFITSNLILRENGTV